MGAQSVEKLKNKYSDSKWRAKYVAFCDLMEILGDCTIGDDYVISDDLNSSIKLTDAGHTMLDRLTRKEKVNAKDARLICALTLGHTELFVDIDSIDVEKVAASIHSELESGALQFPYIWGRELYDAYAELFEDEKELLTTEETLRLLAKLPRGVFQYGEFTVGPFGLRRSLGSRSVPAKRRVSAYHCAVATCHVIHPVALQTSHQASVNRHRDKLDNLLQASTDEPGEWWALASDLSGLIESHYGDQNTGVLLPLIGDTLSDRELRALVAELLDGTAGELRGVLQSFATVQSAAAFVELLGRAELAQIVLIAREDMIATAIDKMVRTGLIGVPLGDIRRPIINKNTKSGAFGLRAELGHYGIRFVSDDRGLALLRERRLLNKLYMRGPDGDVQELEWQLRGIEIDDLDEKLEHFYQTRPPGEALERLVLARKTNMITACHEVGIDSEDGLSDAELVEALMWKLGFPIHAGDDPHSSFWQRHEKLWALAQSSSFGSSDRFLETAGPYFAQLEGLLLDSLAFTTWALMVDHTGSDIPFAYDDQHDREAGLELLQAAASNKSPADAFAPDFKGERVELRNLIEGFRLLGKHLDKSREKVEEYLRPADEFPAFVGKTDLKEFLLRSTLPFLDLSKPSQDRILEGLEQITRTMVDAEVFVVRNDYAHYRRNAPDISRVEQALEAVRQSVTRIENLGFCRLVFTPASITRDRWGQGRHEFEGPRSYEHTFVRPTTLDWMGLPRLTEPQYLMRSASFGDPNEVLRFTRRYDSEFSNMWNSFPKRRRGGPGTNISDEPPTHQADVANGAS